MSIFVLLNLSGDAFWTAYHTELTPADQAAADEMLQLDWLFCSWSPGPDHWSPAPPPPSVPVVVAPPPLQPPAGPPAVPEPATWLMLFFGFVAIVAKTRLRRSLGRRWDHAAS